MRNVWRPVAMFVLCWGLGTVPAGAQAPRARQGLLSLEDARLFYEVVGSGEPIVIVHGGPGLDHGYLQPGMDMLASRNTLVYYDQRGTGRSDVALDTTAVNLDAFVGDIDALRQALGYDQITVLAHSFGVLFGIEYARQYPENLKGLILMAPAEPGQRFADQTATRLTAARSEDDQSDLAELTSSEAFQARDAATLSEVYRVAFRGTFRDRTRVDELDLDLSSRTAQNGQDVGMLLGQSLGTVDWWDRFDSIRTPTLVIHGRYDIPPVAMSRALAEAFPNGRLSVLDSGHFPYIEDPAGLTSAISGFFVEIGR
jgi:proline iminopeptidase